MADPLPNQPPGAPEPGRRRMTRARRLVLILLLAPIAFVLSPLILFVTVCALLVRK